MPIAFAASWDIVQNHASGRSQNEVERIIREIPSLTLSHDQSGGALGIALAMDSPIRVTKGIHDDSRGKHITIELAALGASRTYHIYLQQANFRAGDNTFIWRAVSVN